MQKCKRVQALLSIRTLTRSHNKNEREKIMCSTPSMPSVNTEQKDIAAPTYADASVTKASSNARNKTASLAGRDIKTSARGLGDEATTKKKELLGE